MMNRRDWLTKTSLALAGGLILSDAAMEQYERLTHKKVFALGAMNDDTAYVQSFTHNGLVLPPGRYRMSAPLELRRGATVLGSRFEYPERYGGYYLTTDGDGVVGGSVFWCRSDDLQDMRWCGIGRARTYCLPADWRA